MTDDVAMEIIYDDNTRMKLAEYAEECFFDVYYVNKCTLNRPMHTSSPQMTVENIKR